MRSPTLTLLLVLNGSCAAIEVDSAATIVAAERRSEAGDWDRALELLEPLLEAAELDAKSRSQAASAAARALHRRGEAHFRAGRIDPALADFDRELKLQPDRAAEHWQRGIALYYAERYDAGAEQFARHRTVNPEDVENAAWHFLCKSRAPAGSIDAARQTLIPVTRDPRPPMAQIQRLFAGQASPEDVLKAGAAAGPIGEFYGDLYVGLYYEALGQESRSLRYVARAAGANAGKDSYMGAVARVHVQLRQKANATRPDDVQRPGQ